MELPFPSSIIAAIASCFSNFDRAELDRHMANSFFIAVNAPLCWDLIG